MSERPAQDIAELVAQAAGHPEGLDPLLDSHLETAACLYQLHPVKVEAVRAWAAGAPEPLAAAKARAQPSPVTQHSWRRPAARTPVELLAEAQRRPDGLDVLLRAPVEAAAIQFQAHPFAVEQARLHHAAQQAPGALTTGRPS